MNLRLSDRHTVWQLDCPKGFAVKVTRGRAAIFVFDKAAPLTPDVLREHCAPFGSGDAVECDESQYVLAIGMADDTELVALGDREAVAALPVEFSPTSDDVRSISAAIGGDPDRSGSGEAG